MHEGLHPFISWIEPELANQMGINPPIAWWGPRAHSVFLTDDPGQSLMMMVMVTDDIYRGSSESGIFLRVLWIHLFHPHHVSARKGLVIMAPLDRCRN